MQSNLGIPKELGSSLLAIENTNFKAFLFLSYLYK